jgi:hypothetical protein
VSAPAALAVEAVLIIPFLLFGLSHVVQPGLWRDFFAYLVGLGPKGLIFRSFMVELVPSLLIVVFHQVWHGPAVAVTILGHALLAKLCIALLHPGLAMRGMALAEGSPRRFQIGGLLLIAMGLLCLYLVWAGSGSRGGA